MTRPCPYCAEEIQEEAIACRYCGRDLHLLKPLLEQVAALKQRVEELERERDLDRAARGAESPEPLAEPPVKSSAPQGRKARSFAWSAPVVCVVFLLLAHAVTVLALDLKLVHLRVASLLGPFVFGFLFRRDSRPTLWIDGGTAAAVAVVAVLGMLLVVARVDGVPVLPSGRQDSIEAAQYVTSIGLGFFAGALARQVVLLMWDTDETRTGVLATAARILSHEIFGEEKSAEKRIKKMEGLLTTSLALVAGAVSVVMGLGKLFD